MTAPAVPHRTSTGHLAEVRAVSWACTCGAAAVRTYGLSVDGEYAQRLITAMAAIHETIPHLTTETPCNPE
jgi:pyruvate kinase